MHGDSFGEGFFCATLIIGLFALLLWIGYGASDARRHDLGWGDVACVKTRDLDSGGVSFYTTRCVTAPELAKWLRSKQQ